VNRFARIRRDAVRSGFGENEKGQDARKSALPRDAASAMPLLPRSIEIDDAKMIGTEEERCPWCGQGTKMLGGVEVIYCQCYRCRQYVCLGASTDKEFRCCPQCGNRSTRMSEIEEKTRLASLLPKPLSLAAGHARQLAAPGRASLPAPARLQLPNGRR